mgnify:CR=1 FL=1
MPSIQTNGLTKVFGEDVVAVDDLDLAIEEGEIFGFLGPNGAGKSTTINMLLDFIRPTDGSAQVLGIDAQENPRAIRERVGVLPEGFGFDGNLTGREYVTWTIETKGTTDDPDAILDEVGILDEPSSGLDPNGIQHMRSILRDRADDGATVFFSSHILSEVEAVCDRVGVMNEGRMVAVDTIDNLRDQAGGTASIELECASPPGDLGVERVDDVTDVTVEETALTVEVADPSAKVDVVEHVAGRAEVVDILSKETSLEELFNTYTGGGRDADGAAGGEEATGEPGETQEVSA